MNTPTIKLATASAAIMVVAVGIWEGLKWAM